MQLELDCEYLNDGASHCMKLACRFAKRDNRQFVSPQDILLALARQDYTPSHQVLKDAGLTEGTIANAFNVELLGEIDVKVLSET